MTLTWNSEIFTCQTFYTHTHTPNKHIQESKQLKYFHGLWITGSHVSSRVWNQCLGLSLIPSKSLSSGICISFPHFSVLPYFSPPTSSLNSPLSILLSFPSCSLNWVSILLVLAASKCTISSLKYYNLSFSRTNKLVKSTTKTRIDAANEWVDWD